MKIVHLPASFLPYYTGGKEVFVAHLATELQRMGHENRIIIHRDTLIPSSINHYEYQGIPVDVLPGVGISHTQYWQSEASIDDSFEQLLQQYRPDVVHFHDQSGGASLTHLRIVKRLGIKTLLTYHSPGQSCPQRALLYRGKYLCDGKLDVKRCSKCLYACKGIPPWGANILTRMGVLFENIENSSFKRLLSISSLVKRYIESFNEIYSLVDGVQVYAHWVEPLLTENGVNASKIFYATQAIPALTSKDILKPDLDIQSSLKLVFVGRCTYIKGVHVLIDAIKLLPKDFPVEVHFLGPYWDDTSYGRTMLKRIRGDRRFKEPMLLPPSEVLSYISSMDALVVPSLWPETGPFVVHEAFRAGIPVIGTRAAGIAERVEHLHSGLLFDWGNARQLADCIELMYRRKKKGELFSIPQLPDISAMANRMVQIYSSL
ncbi:MAG: glycosyltransferase [Bacteroidales bacterium]